MSLRFKKIIVRLRMWYAKFRGHKGHRWDYEPSEWYMGKHNKRKNKMNDKKYIVMRKYEGSKEFYQDRAFKTVEDADAYAKLMQKQEDKDGHQYFLFEQSKHYGNGKA